MDNFFLSQLDLEPLYESISHSDNLDKLYFSPQEEEIKIEEKGETIENLLASFEADSEKTITLKLNLMKLIKKHSEKNKYDILYSASDYINKYFYQLILLDMKEINELNNLLS